MEHLFLLGKRSSNGSTGLRARIPPGSITVAGQRGNFTRFLPPEQPLCYGPRRTVSSLKPGGLPAFLIGHKLKLMTKKALLLMLATISVTPQAHASGLQFHELMRGKIQSTPSKKLSFNVDLKASMPDIDAWSSSPDHPAPLKGTASVEGLIIPVTGVLNLAVPSQDANGTPGHALHYTFGSDPGVIPQVQFDGQKFVPIHRDYLFLVKEMTTLNGIATYQLDESDPVTEAPAQVVFEWYDPFVMIPFLASFKISGAHGNELERARVRAKFLEIFFGGLLSNHTLMIGE